MNDLAALLHEALTAEYTGCWHPEFKEYPDVCQSIAARLEMAGVRVDRVCECGHPDICTPPSEDVKPSFYNVGELKDIITKTIDQLLSERQGLGFTEGNAQAGIIQAKNRILQEIERR